MYVSYLTYQTYRRSDLVGEKGNIYLDLLIDLQKNAFERFGQVCCAQNGRHVSFLV